MSNHSFLFYTLICFSICSCSPRVATNIAKSYPPQEPDAPVVIYTRQQDVPPQSESLGTLIVDDAGFTTQCDSVTVFSIAKDETRKVGGNGFLLTAHSRPSIWSTTCHRIAGTMLFISDFTMPSTDAALSNINNSVSKRLQPRMTLSFDAGYGWRTAKLSDELNSYLKEFMKHLMSGFALDASFIYFCNDFYGVGLNYYQYGSSHKDYAQDLNTLQSGELKKTVRITYIAPVFPIRFPFGTSKNVFLLDINLSIGYIGYKSMESFVNYNAVHSGSSIGFRSDIGLSYKFSPEWAIGFKLTSATGTLSQMEVNENGKKTTTKFDVGKSESLEQAGITLGIRYYIK